MAEGEYKRLGRNIFFKNLPLLFLERILHYSIKFKLKDMISQHHNEFTFDEDDIDEFESEISALNELLNSPKVSNELVEEIKSTPNSIVEMVIANDNLFKVRLAFHGWVVRTALTIMNMRF